MKKAFVLMMCVLLALMPGAMADAAGGAAGATVDLTGVIVSVVMLAFDVLLAWAAKTLLPAVKAWLDERTTESQQRRLYEITGKLVEAAEQVFIGEGLGSEKLKYVIDGLRARGYRVDVEVIEAAVKEMNDRTLGMIEEVIVPGEEEELPFAEPEEEPPDPDADYD